MTNRWAKLPEPHQALISYDASVMRAKFPEESEDELYRAEGVIAMLVKSRRRANKRIWTLDVTELDLHLERVQDCPMLNWKVYWAPEGRVIANVEARTEKEAIRKAPKPYRKYLGEMYAEAV